MYGDGSVSEHGLDTSRGDDDLLFTSFDFVSEGNQDAELDLVWISGNGKERSTRKLHFVHFDVGNGRAKRARPVDQPIAAENGAIFVKTNEPFDHGAVELAGEEGGWW